MKINQSSYSSLALLIVLGISDATATSLESIAGAVGGSSSCNTYGSRPPINTFFGGYFSIGTTGNGVSDCGMQGGVQDSIAAKGPLTTTHSVSASINGVPYTGTSRATSNFGELSVAAHGNLPGLPGVGNYLRQSGGFSFFNDQLTFNSPTQASGDKGKVVYTFTIGGALATPVSSQPFVSENIANLSVKQDSFFQGNIFTARTSGTSSVGTILGNPSYPGFSMSNGAVQGEGQFSTTQLPFVWGKPSDLTVGLAGVSIPMGTSLDVLLNAALSGIEVYDASGNLLNNFNINSASGSVYSANGVAIVTTPIPAAFGLLGSGLLGLIGVRRRPIIVHLNHMD